MLGLNIHSPGVNLDLLIELIPQSVGDATSNRGPGAETDRAQPPAAVSVDEADRPGEGGPHRGPRLLVRHSAHGHAAERDPAGNENGRSRITAERRRERRHDENGDGQTANHVG